MYNNNQSKPCGVNRTVISQNPEPSPINIAIGSASVNGGLVQINLRLSEVRSRLFGEQPLPPCDENGPMPPAATSLDEANQRVAEALSQLEYILSRM